MSGRTSSQLRQQLKDKLKAKRNERTRGQVPGTHHIRMAKEMIAKSTPQELDEAAQLLATEHGAPYVKCFNDLRAEVEGKKEISSSGSTNVK